MAKPSLIDLMIGSAIFLARASSSSDAADWAAGATASSAIFPLPLHCPQ